MCEVLGEGQEGCLPFQDSRQGRFEARNAFLSDETFNWLFLFSPWMLGSSDSTDIFIVLVP